MAYGNYIEVQFKDEEDNLYHITLLRDGYTGAVEHRDAAPDALKIEFGDSASGEFPGIMGSRAVFRFHQETGNNEFPTLYTSENRRYKVQITKNAAMYWLGWVKTENYRTSMDYFPVVEVVATDGLADLREQQFVNYTGYATNRQSRHQIIADMLAVTDLDLNFTVATQIVEANITGNPFVSLYADVDAYEGKDCRTVLEDCLLTHTLVQKGGVWTIRHWQCHSLANIYKYTYNVAGALQSAGTVANPTKQVDYDSSYFTGNPSLEYVRALRKVTVNTNYKHINTNLVKNSDMLSGWDNWTDEAGLTEKWIFVDTNGERYIRLDDAGEFASGDRPMLQQAIPLKALEFSTLSFEYSLFPEVAPPNTACEFFQLRLVSNSTTYYGYLELVNSEVRISFNTTSNWIPTRYTESLGVFTPEYVDPTEETSFKKFSLPLHTGSIIVNDTAILYLCLGAPSTEVGTNHGVRANFKGIVLEEKVQDNPLNASDTRSLKAVDYSYAYEIDENPYLKEIEVDVLTGNHPNKNTAYTSKHILSYSLDEADVANQFSLYPNPEMWTWEQLIAEVYSAFFKRPLNSVVGQLKGVDPWDIVVDSADWMRYVYSGVSFDAATGICDGRLIEVLPFAPDPTYDEALMRDSGDGDRVTGNDVRAFTIDPDDYDVADVRDTPDDDRTTGNDIRVRKRL